MKIKTSDDPARSLRAVLASLAHLRKYRLTMVLVLPVVTFVLGVAFRGSGGYQEAYATTASRLQILERDNLRLLGRLGVGVFARPKHIVISIKFTDFQKIEQQRAKALGTGVLNLTDDDYVPATVECGGKSVAAKIRLKGDLADHLDQGDKWSLRVKTKGDHTFLGMKQFSLQHPNTRNYVYEWIFHQALLRADILGLRYEFVKVTLNGRDLGVYALEEHFEKRLVEHNRRREGPIIRFNEDRLWDEWEQQKIPFQGARQDGSGSYLASDVDVFQTLQWTSDPAARPVYERAVALLQGFREGRYRTSEVFDVGRLAMFLAITDLMGAEHGARWHNTRFYFNPITARLEPIGFDADAGRPVTSLCFHMKDRHWSYNAWSSDPTYFKSLFNDSLLVESYLACLQHVSQRSYLDSLLTAIDAPLRDNLRIIHSEFPTFDFSKDVLYRNQDYIRTVLAPRNAIAAHAKPSTGDRIELRIGNLQCLPVDVLGASCDGVNVPISPHFLPLPGRAPDELVDHREVYGTLPAALDWADSLLPHLRVQFRIPGTGQVRDCAVTGWPYPDPPASAQDVVRRPANVHDFNFLHVNERQRTIAFDRGTWIIATDLIIPPGYRVTCGPGTRLNLNSSALILSRSPLEFDGTDEEPIVVTSMDGTGQGLVVMEAGGESFLQHVAFEGLMSPVRGNWLTGAVTFFESPISVRDCAFVRLHAEDSMNVIRSRFRIFDSLFVGSQSDAFDADFGVGEIRRTTFRDCGNDAIDVSGTNAELSDIHVYKAGDKGISAGEGSHVRADSVWIEASNIGLGVKDLSFLQATEVHIAQTAVGCAAYQKKPEFGPASATIHGLHMTAVITPFVIERNSQLDVDGQQVQQNSTHVWQQLEQAQHVGRGAASIVTVPVP